MPNFAVRILLPAARGIALFLALFTLLNILGDCLSSGFDSNIWWISLSPIRHHLADLILAIAALALLLFALWNPAPAIFRRFIQLSSALLLLTTLLNAVSFYVLLARQNIRSAFPIPLSLFLAMSLVAVFLAALA